VMVELDIQTAGDIRQQHGLRTILLEHRGEDESGKIPVIAVISSLERREIVRLGAQFRVQNHEATVSALLKAGFRARAEALLVG